MGIGVGELLDQDVLVLEELTPNSSDDVIGVRSKSGVVLLGVVVLGKMLKKFSPFLLLSRVCTMRLGVVTVGCSVTFCARMRSASCAASR